MRRVRGRLPVRLYFAVAKQHGGVSWQGAGQREDLRWMPALRRGLRMGRNLYHAVRTEGGVPEFDRLLEHRERRRLTESRTLAAGKSSELAEWPAPCFFGPARAIVAIMIAM